jgi:E3 SUMO-protein ligase RanBP2
MIFYFCFRTESVQVVFEKKATPAQLKLATDLKLPPNFFLYESAPPCPGCRGCTDELETPASGSVKTDAPAPKPTTTTEETEPKPINTTPSMASWNLTASSGADLSFSTLATTSGSVGFNKSGNFSWSGTGQRLFEVKSSSILENVQ